MEIKASKEDEFFMRKALQEGRKGLGRTSPNPPVGAVVVKNGQIVGRGYHRKAGTPHAEVHALREAGEEARGATIYVTLEPCNHQGRTPPCTQAILRAGIKRVVIGCPDPNPKAKGGAEFLKEKGLEVVTGVLVKECAVLCRFFLKSVTQKYAWIIAKAAMSLDGRIATRTGDSKWITGEAARRFGHRLRNICDAILVGKNTVILDNPSLTCRIRGGRDPIRIVLDTKLSLPLTYKIFQQKRGKTILACSEQVDKKKVKAFEEAGVEVWPLPLKEGMIDLYALGEKALSQGILSILVEGGATVHGSFFDSGLVDEIAFFYGPYIIGGEAAPAAILGQGAAYLKDAFRLSSFSLKRLGDSFLVSGFLTDPLKLQ
ncbi:bifunctional diaminohydroxyphosphoribosylaminopyrimidine deaminase/5-amino-6-(5-phosphoribosylamino)uracil reductase RibD [Thermodesulfatator atlanticus]|uniref:bifunctional diaminohydroxyphosphoribosylaminopyrimidine deaminase/5-amino-6-(5-phosphoribosylamino)uracil reductase RibD n=1 Tax=Thermodesulfatator atlanticus TaxID=501497 RepID=UPI0003B4C253|nr:bifunctional diaminohydroxyphosphoribosylaminopyrimidine deaminase/5-amino-6-(5-phosphoribosylamino)uracil reductase RibD [Thermodesulfatator atlanticus]